MHELFTGDFFMEELQEKKNNIRGILSQSYRPSPDALLNPLADPTFKALFTDSSPEAIFVFSKLTPNQMWGKFFLYASNSEKQDFVNELAKHNRGIQMAVTVLKNISQDEINWYHETRYWMSVSDKKSMISSAEDRGIKKGLEQGLQKKAIEDAKNLLIMKIGTPEQISQAIGLPLEKVLDLQKQIPSKEKSSN